ncbi:MAG: hypothetical protein EHM24_09145 [Acidobacteria bacterium]|nr:MAG: hypothetical protein EHM24_09145 [Acidobacteriota bacterium]
MSPRNYLHLSILTTAVEGGIAYWCNEPADDGTKQVHCIERDRDGNVITVVFDQRAVEAVSGATIPAGRRIEAVDGRPHVIIDAAALARGLRAVHEGRVTWGGQPHPTGRMVDLARRAIFALTTELAEDLAGDIDAGDADNLLQAALFGDVVYG